MIYTYGDEIRSHWQYFFSVVCFVQRKQYFRGKICITQGKAKSWTVALRRQTASPADKESGQRRPVPAGTVRRAGGVWEGSCCFSWSHCLQALQIKLDQLNNGLKLGSMK